MPKKKNNDTSGELAVTDYRHPQAKRKNIPPAKIAAEGVVPPIKKIPYSYSPRRSPELRFDPNASPDKLPPLLAKARQQALTESEVKQLATALRHQEPWLEWAGKLEQNRRGLKVDPVALHIHERISAQAILKVASRQDVQRDLFADPQQSYAQAVQFYKHDIGWTNRMILGDSLQVMASLAQREDLAGKVQMIYMDPPYGIKFGSNFQPEIGKRKVEDKEADLTRELETVKAYRDTWTLGVHSYLAYLRDRLVLGRELLTDSGSIFVQISDENVHRVRHLLDEIFGGANFISEIAVQKTAGKGGGFIDPIYDTLLWYAKDRSLCKFRRLYRTKSFGEDGAEEYTAIELPSGERRTMTPQEKRDNSIHPQGARVYRLDNLTSQSRSQTTVFDYSWEGKTLGPGAGGWKTNLEGMNRLARAHRIRTRQIGNTICYVRYLDDFPAIPISNLWTDVSSGFNVYQPKIYVVQTNERIVERCLLMTTDPGDLVIDPTCGSGTTSEIAEQWGRRWITIDTSRVALSLARQRLLTARFEYFNLRDESRGVAGGFHYKTVPHITLRSIAQNTNLDSIFLKHEPILDAALLACNQALTKVTDDIRTKLAGKLRAKERVEGKKSVTDLELRKWQLPKRGEKWQHWQIPFDTDPDWPIPLQQAVTTYRQAWHLKTVEINACIAANAEQEELVDRPEIKRGVVRVSGPFTVEAVQPPEISLTDESEFDGAPDVLHETFDMGVDAAAARQNIEAYLDQMMKLLKVDGVRFPDNKQMKFTRLERINGTDGGVHAEGRWIPQDEEDKDADGRATVAVAFGPQYGPITAKQVEDLIRTTNRRGYDNLVVAGFSFDGAAQATIAEASHPKLRVHMAHIRPDVNPGMAGLLKEQPGSQLFSVFGQPRTSISGPDKEKNYIVTMEGVDIYDPVGNTIQSTADQKVAAWFLDGDYDGRTFCITQAFFPDKSAWEKLAKALGGVVDGDRFEALSGTKSLPFPAGPNKCVAIKVIDPRGNEVMAVHKL